MFTICFWTPGKGWVDVAQVSGDEVAMDAYFKACELAELVGATCALVDASTGEIVESNIEEEFEGRD